MKKEGNNITPWEQKPSTPNDTNIQNYLNNTIKTNVKFNTFNANPEEENQNIHLTQEDNTKNPISSIITKTIIIASSGILNKIDSVKSEKDANDLLEDVRDFVSSDKNKNIEEILEKIEKKIELLNQDGFYSNEDDEKNQKISDILLAITKSLKEKLEHSRSSTPKSSKSGFSSGHSSYTNYNPEYQDPFITLTKKNDTVKALEHTSSAIRDNIEKTELENKIKILKDNRQLMQNSLNVMKQDKSNIDQAIQNIENTLQHKNDDNFTQQVNELAKKLNNSMKSLCSIVLDKDNQYKWDFMKTFIQEDRDEIVKYLSNKIINAKRVLGGDKIPDKYSIPYKNGNKIPCLNENINLLKEKIKRNDEEIIDLEEKLRNNTIKYNEITRQYPNR